MKVHEHKLQRDDGTAVPFREAFCQSGELVAPKFLMIHFTGGDSFENACTWLTRKPKPKSKDKGSSAHAVIGRGGELAQLVEFNKRAWHAGDSKYSSIDSDRLHQTYTGLNAHAIGLELVNHGGLHRTAIGWATQDSNLPVGGDNVVLAEHKYPGWPFKGWQAFTEKQILAAYETCEALIDAYPSIVDVIGHDDVAPGRKCDPGPAFPMARFRGWLFGRGQG